MNNIIHPQLPREPTFVSRTEAYRFLLFIRSISQATIGFTPDIGNVAESYRRKILETADLTDTALKKEFLALADWIAAAEKFVWQFDAETNQI